MGSPDGDPELARRAVAITRLLLPYSNLAADHVALDTCRQGSSMIRASHLVVENPFAFGANVVEDEGDARQIQGSIRDPSGAVGAGRTRIAEDRKELEEASHALWQAAA